MNDPAPFGSLICDDYAQWCDCCGRVVRETRRSMWHGSDALCFACLSVWYDAGPSHGSAADIRDYVLAAEAAGTWPFPHPKAERVPV